MNRRLSRQRCRIPIALLASVLLGPCTTHATVDLTGEWTTHYSGTPDPGYPGPDGPLRIVQDGTSITYGQLRGTIDPETGEFQIVLASPQCTRPLGIYARATDSNHFTGSIGGEFAPLPYTPCRPFGGGGAITGERVTPTSIPSPTPTATPTATPLRCVGDCDGNGQATVDELVRLVDCMIGIRPWIIADPCDLACADANGSGGIEVNELVTAVNNALRGCPR